MNRLICLMVVVVLLSCGGGSVTGVSGSRVVSLVPSVTEIIYAVGAEDRLVGNTTYCNHPAAAKEVYKVGDFQNPDIERIVALKPNLVFVTLPVQRLVAEKLQELGIRVHVSSPRSVEGVLQEIDSIGILLGVADRAGPLADSLRRRLDSLPAYPDTPRVYLEISTTPLMSAGGGTFLDGAVSRAGGRNIFSAAAQEYPLVDPEMIVQADPEVILILCPAVTADGIGRRLGWDRVSAVRQSRVFDDPELDLLVRPGPKVVDAIVALARRLHPE